MRAVKLQYAEIRSIISNMSEASYSKYGSYSYAAGYLESQLADVMADLPANKQNDIIRILQQTINQLQKA